ncbi:permease-like cell division protein FtsX [Corynebacterium sp. TAE3-ERU12]|uniref:permease-like cell division protein FtsX n=1 Tax=Corynebacterium sp. TAE3-ERU12 TaxID=2849491 RepID=UPI001C44719E|nr:permease-like cell division protein FtsX [Corynebacterium sp. TAE3-ERU12]MBV7295671.1 permease-like cell division protein FtsX [Corynebacterium sp. TAE3-ERU12]
MKTRFVLGEAFAGLRANVTMTVAMIITTAISLALLCSGVLVTDMTARTKQMYFDRVEVMIELDEKTSTEDDNCSSKKCEEVLSTLEGTDGVNSVTFRNRAQNYQHFVDLFEVTDPALVDNTTPESLPAVILVRLEDPTDLSPIAPVRDLKQVTHVTDQADDVNAAAENLDSIRNATFVIAGIQAVAAVLLIANMVQIAAYSRRKEVGIMLMVGASRLFTQAPFVLEAVLATFIGGLLALGGLFLGKQTVLDPALDEIYRSQLIAPIEAADIWLVAPIVIGIGMVFSALTAHITLRLYTRR